MRGWDAERVATAAGARLLRAGPSGSGPTRAVIDSRAVEPGDLFVGLRGTQADGGQFAAGALAAGAWGVLIGEGHDPGGDGAVLVAADPLVALQSLARAWRRALAVPVVAVTGSVGKTSTKDLMAAMASQSKRVVASRENFNTEIGMPLEILAAPGDSEGLVLELAMRGAGQIAELVAICEPDAGVITNIGPVHLELLGSIEAIAAAKAELIAGMRPGAVAIVPADEPLLEPHLRGDLETVRFGPGGDLDFESVSAEGDWARVVVDGVELELPFTSAHMLRNTLAAYAGARALGAAPRGRVDFRPAALRGERLMLGERTVVLNDCYNANPLSMRAALDDLSALEPAGRRIAVLGDMLELGPAEREMHREIGAAARDAGVEVLVTVGPLAAEMGRAFDGETYSVRDAAAAADLVRTLVRPGDALLVKASRGVGLEVVAEALADGS